MKRRRDNILTRRCRTGSIDIDKVSDCGELSIEVRADPCSVPDLNSRRGRKSPDRRGFRLRLQTPSAPLGALPRHTCKRQQPLLLPNHACKAQTHQNKPVGKKKLPTRAEYSRCSGAGIPFAAERAFAYSVLSKTPNKNVASKYPMVTLMKLRPTWRELNP